jgi:hypothetical protein
MYGYYIISGNVEKLSLWVIDNPIMDVSEVIVCSRIHMVV